MATSVCNITSTVFARAVSENCDWAAVVAACGVACSAQECEKAFFTLFVPNSAHIPMPVPTVVEPEVSISIKQEETPVMVLARVEQVVAKPTVKVSQPKPVQSFTMVDANKKRVRRKATQIKRLFQCVVEGCCRSYGTEGALKMHLKLKHPDVTYDPMNPPVIVDYVMKTTENGNIVTTKRRQRFDDEEESASGSIDDLNTSPPQSPVTTAAIPQSPIPSFDALKAPPQPLRTPVVPALPQFSAMMHPSAVFSPQTMFNPAYPPMMPPMYAPSGFPSAASFMPWAMPPAQTLLSTNSTTTMKRTAPEMDLNMAPQTKRAKTASDESDILSTLVSLKGQ